MSSTLARGADAPTATIVIEPRHGWRELGIRELWEHRELFYFFVWRDLKVRYRQTFFGAAWAVLQPFLMMVVFSISVGRIPGIGPDGVPYPVFIFAGLVPWTLFAQGLSASSNSLVSGENIITKVYFPRLLLPASAIASFVLDFLVGVVALVVLMLVFGTPISVTIVWAPLVGLLAAATTLGVGVFLGAVNVRYRDVRYVVPFLVQLWLFASPVIYTSGLVPEAWRWAYALNPMVGVVEAFRWSVFGGALPVSEIAVSVAATGVVLGVALVYFRRVERTFADVI
jgi:lipopolysaccharide transport system permease protein